MRLASILRGRRAKSNNCSDSAHAIVFNLAGQIAGRFSEPLLQTRFVRATDQPGARARVVPEMRVWFNENLESRNFYVPGAIVLIVTSSP